MPRLPQRIVCLTTETVEVLYALGEQDRIVGISGYTVRPPEARKEKPKVFAFTTGDIDKIPSERGSTAPCPRARKRSRAMCKACTSGG